MNTHDRSRICNNVYTPTVKQLIEVRLQHLTYSRIFDIEYPGSKVGMLSMKEVFSAMADVLIKDGESAIHLYSPTGACYTELTNPMTFVDPVEAIMDLCVSYKIINVLDAGTDQSIIVTPRFIPPKNVFFFGYVASHEDIMALKIPKGNDGALAFLKLPDGKTMGYYNCGKAWEGALMNYRNPFHEEEL